MEKITNEMFLFWKEDSVFSNWYNPSQFEFDSKMFYNSETAFMYSKAKFFGDTKTAELICNSGVPSVVKKLGRQVANFDQKIWDDNKIELMYLVCFEKFTADPAITSKLLATGNRIIVEASPVDKIWGIGLAPDDPLALSVKTWKGQNLLGGVLMTLRDQLS